MSAAPPSFGVEPLPAPTSGNAASLAEPQEDKVDEPTHAHMALQEGEGAHFVPSSADEVVAGTAAAAATAKDPNSFVAPTQDGSDAMMMKSGTEAPVLMKEWFLVIKELMRRRL
jgi:hypothetical protein